MVALGLCKTPPPVMVIPTSPLCPQCRIAFASSGRERTVRVSRIHITLYLGARVSSYPVVPESYICIVRIVPIYRRSFLNIRRVVRKTGDKSPIDDREFGKSRRVRTLLTRPYRLSKYLLSARQNAACFFRSAVQFRSGAPRSGALIFFSHYSRT